MKKKKKKIEKKKKKIEKKKLCNAFARGGGRICPNGHFPQYKYS